MYVYTSICEAVTIFRIGRARRHRSTTTPQKVHYGNDNSNNSNNKRSSTKKRIMPEYKSTGPIDPSVPIDTTKLQDVTAVITGGANGIGEGYVRALVQAGCYVCVGDLDETAGHALEKELAPRVRFVKVDVTNWDDQVALFSAAAELAPDGRIAHVVANAGIHRRDSVFNVDVSRPPTKPELPTIEVNVVAALYTVKLALWYFVKQNGTTPGPGQRDTSLTLIGSGGAFLDLLRAPQYAASKWAMRGVMRSLRRTAHLHGSRVNLVSPWYVRSKILTEEMFDQVEKTGVQIASMEDAQKALLRLCSDENVNGRALFVSPRKWKEEGFWDLDIDDYAQARPEVEIIQTEQLWGEPLERGLFTS